MTELRVIRLPNGPFKQNCYILAEDKQAILIDPGSDAPMIHAALQSGNVTPIAILNTHGHFDHVGAVVDMVDTYDIPFYIHDADTRLVSSANIYRLLFKTKTSISIPTINYPLTDDVNSLTLGNFTFEVLQTPGHTPGGLCFRIKNLLFTGDTLMGTGPGTTTLPGGNPASLDTSIKKLRKIDPAVIVYPGHGREQPLFKIWERYDAS